MGIRGGFVLAFWRRFFWIAAEVVFKSNGYEIMIIYIYYYY